MSTHVEVAARKSTNKNAPPEALALTFLPLLIGSYNHLDCRSSSCQGLTLSKNDRFPKNHHPSRSTRFSLSNPRARPPSHSSQGAEGDLRDGGPVARHAASLPAEPADLRRRGRTKGPAARTEDHGTNPRDWAERGCGLRGGFGPPRRSVVWACRRFRSVGGTGRFKSFEFGQVSPPFHWDRTSGMVWMQASLERMSELGGLAE